VTPDQSLSVELLTGNTGGEFAATVSSSRARIGHW